MMNKIVKCDVCNKEIKCLCLYTDKELKMEIERRYVIKFKESLEKTRKENQALINAMGK